MDGSGVGFNRAAHTHRRLLILVPGTWAAKPESYGLPRRQQRYIAPSMPLVFSSHGWGCASGGTVKQGAIMEITAAALIIWAVVGVIIGWLASQIMTQGSAGI